ncbi:leucyl aminopeptidase [Roseobacter denitrificans]|uniref:Leucine aminopeptidase, putative n=1 Tax=Roseobacter denitrificans (strain ATCC 33942 / OCh 114) TaxID=375451 RepID=Q16DA5_ROSDO|nr:leucyl aminopeptidase family protein [Roseobacter denitrificans]ABG30038.1 leucine aminopeptidase, putative [Roseobacter denitrificans OCh 114]AVL53239.1 leucyl aminopeptidase [Roseobacter denitrificans]SFF68962.1 leucyl aminopeptidase [Roseobacter denitrificans OCh 114]
MTSLFADADDQTIPLHIIDEDSLEAWLGDQSQTVQAWVRANGFAARIGQALLVPSDTGLPVMALAGFGTAKSRARGRFHLAAAASKLPAACYAIASGLPQAQSDMEVLGWLLAAYRFGRYSETGAMGARLARPEGLDTARLEILAQAETLTRDLINTPANDMGPPDLEAAAQDLAQQHGASIEVVLGDDLLAQDFPLIHTVGRAADRAPRLIDMKWGDRGPKITLVGKGVCFDTGGLNLKPGASMGLMKKDMGGAANVLGLAHMIMALQPRISLRVLIPAVENSVAGNAFRPGDILPSRKGLSVEINNTDAEGRLVLADALAYAQEDAPDLIISMATLTGAARVAVGPDLAPYYCDDPDFVTALENAATHQCDPVWRMPFHTPYESMIEPGIADLDNAPKGGFAGSITAALFLRRFVDESVYAHFDVYGWNPSDAPGRPKGGAGQATRALLGVIEAMQTS